MMSTLLQASSFFVIGFVEMFLATQRTYWISTGRSRAAALLVFFENFIAFYVIVQAVNNFNSNIWLLVIYAAGNALGTYINLEKVSI